MREIFFRSIMLFPTAAMVVLISCTKTDDVIPKPEISVTPIIPNQLNESISGIVLGANVQLYHVVAYARMNDGWYSLPAGDNPIIAINSDRSWVCRLSNFEKDMIKELAIYLLPNGFNPPILTGEPLIPIKMNLVSAAKTKVQL